MCRYRKRGLALIPTKFGIAFTAMFLNQVRHAAAAWPSLMPYIVLLLLDSRFTYDGHTTIRSARRTRIGGACAKLVAAWSNLLLSSVRMDCFSG